MVHTLGRPCVFPIDRSRITLLPSTYQYQRSSALSPDSCSIPSPASRCARATQDTVAPSVRSSRTVSRIRGRRGLQFQAERRSHRATHAWLGWDQDNTNVRHGRGPWPQRAHRTRKRVESARVNKMRPFPSFSCAQPRDVPSLRFRVPVSCLHTGCDRREFAC